MLKIYVYIYIYIILYIIHAIIKLYRENFFNSSLSCGDRTPVAGTPPPMEILFRASLPWRPKVREEDIEVFLQAERFVSSAICHCKFQFRISDFEH